MAGVLLNVVVSVKSSFCSDERLTPTPFLCTLYIQTIGDSYVAVCGLPEPRKDHAVVMAKFAADVRGKTIRLTQELRHTLGDGTEKLQIRIGLHSGSCTAGKHCFVYSSGKPSSFWEAIARLGSSQVCPCFSLPVQAC